MIHRCKTCPHWTGGNGQWGQCALMDSTSHEPDDSTTLAYGADQEIYSAWGVTHENFGCVMHPENGGERL